MDVAYMHALERNDAISCVAFAFVVEIQISNFLREGRF